MTAIKIEEEHDLDEVLGSAVNVKVEPDLEECNTESIWIKESNDLENEDTSTIVEEDPLGDGIKTPTKPLNVNKIADIKKKLTSLLTKTKIEGAESDDEEKFSTEEAKINPNRIVDFKNKISTLLSQAESPNVRRHPHERRQDIARVGISQSRLGLLRSETNENENEEEMILANLLGATAGVTNEQEHSDIRNYAPDKEKSTNSETKKCKAKRRSSSITKQQSSEEEDIVPSHFYCNHCNRIFPDLLQLKIHEAVELTKKRQKCYICKMSFANQSGDLRDHLLLHLEPKPYFECDVCNNTYRQKVDLISHMRLHFPDESDVCVCPHKRKGRMAKKPTSKGSKPKRKSKWRHIKYNFTSGVDWT